MLFKPNNIIPFICDVVFGQNDDIKCEDYSREEIEASLRHSTKPDRATVGPVLHGCKNNGEAVWSLKYY